MANIQGRIVAEAQIYGNMLVPTEAGVEPYTGEYSFTPSQSVQTVNTSNKKLADNIVVQPIPSNYGRISWNGVTLSVT